MLCFFLQMQQAIFVPWRVLAGISKFNGGICRKCINWSVKMKQKLSVVIVSVIFAFVLGAACKSAPPPQPGSIEEYPAPVAVDDEETIEELVIVEEVDPEVVEAVDFDSIGLLIAEAKAKREEIENDGISDTGDNDLFAAGEELANAETIYDLGPDGSTAKEKLTATGSAQFALDTYNRVFEAWWSDKAGEARNKASGAQQEALKLKADVAVRDDYLACADIFNNGVALFKAKNYKASLDYFSESGTLFAGIATLAAEKRRLAALALQSAERKIEETERIAADADSVLNGEQL
jgi:hypothetical protein